MPSTVYFTATTIDGFIADEHNSLDWLFAVPSTDEGKKRSDEAFDRFIAHCGAMVMGATTYEWVLEHERVLTEPERWQEFYHGIPAWVLTHRDLPRVPGADLRFAQGPVEELHPVLREAAGDKDIWVVGGGELAGQFADHGLLDTIVLGMAPATVGAGAPLLPRRLGGRLTLTDVERIDQFVRLTYRVAPPT